uniref:Uncharacterized protein n=1 Tax=Anguilla anguilla TaxID=7936 RepID=A0A0E9QD85_ANGAN
MMLLWILSQRFLCPTMYAE